MRTLFLAAALSATALAGVAGTAAVAQQGGGMMARADANGDGIITHAEFMASATERFTRMDANNDGKLSGDELRGPMAARAQGGVIIKAAFMAEADTRFQQLDTNHDGKLTPDELAAMRARVQNRGGEDGRGAENRGGDHDMAEQMPPADGPRGFGGRLERLDTNHDGRISRDEMRADADRRFDRMDTNHDGFIDQAEMDAARPPRRGGPGGDMPPPPQPGAGPDRNTGQ